MTSIQQTGVLKVSLQFPHETEAFRARLAENCMLSEQRDWRERQQRAPFQPEEFCGLPPTQRARARMMNDWLRHGVLRAPIPSLPARAWRALVAWFRKPCTMLPCPCERCWRNRVHP